MSTGWEATLPYLIDKRHMGPDAPLWGVITEAGKAAANRPTGSRWHHGSKCSTARYCGKGAFQVIVKAAADKEQQQSEWIAPHAFSRTCPNVPTS